MNENYLNEIKGSLFKTILLLETEEECSKFFRDLCTMSELKSMAERLEVVKKLEKKETYRHISKETGASSATITRIAHWLNYGEGGYKLVLEKLKNQKK